MGRKASVADRCDDAPSKRAFVASALRLFVSQGLCETTVRHVAEDAGFTNPAIFKFFRSRDELALCVFERCYESLAGVIAEAAKVSAYEARLRAIIAAAASFMDHDLDAFLFVTEQLRRFWPQAAPSIRKESIVEIVHDLFAVGIAEHRVAADHDPALLVAATIGTLSQFGRALYFHEIEGPAARRAPELGRLLSRMFW